MNSHLFVCLQHAAKEREQKGASKPVEVNDTKEHQEILPIPLTLKQLKILAP